MAKGGKPRKPQPAPPPPAAVGLFPSAVLWPSDSLTPGG